MRSTPVGDAGIAGLAAYSTLAFPLAFAGLPVYLHAPDFYASELGLPLASLGIALLVMRAIDAVQDPFIGYVSDRFNRQRAFIVVAGIVLLGTGFWMLFHPPGIKPLVWFCAAVFVCTTGFSIVSINLQTLGGLWHATKNERTKVTSWREGATLLGVLCAAMVPQLLGSLENPQSAFHLLSLIYLPLLAASAIIFFRWLARAALDKPPQIKRASPRKASASRWRRTFFGIYFINGIANAIPGVLLIFYVRDRLGVEELIGLFLLLYFASGALAIPMWQIIASRIGKYRCWLISMLFAVATFFWASFLGQGDGAPFAAVCLLSGTALGADLCLPPSMLADHIHSEATQDSASRDFAIITFLSKSSLALATGVMFAFLGTFGFQPGAINTADHAIYLTVAYATVPCAIKLLCAAWLWRAIPELVASAPSEHTIVTHAL